MSQPKKKYIEHDEFCVCLRIWGDDHDPEPKWESFEVGGESPVGG